MARNGTSSIVSDGYAGNGTGGKKKPGIYLVGNYVKSINGDASRDDTLFGITGHFEYNFDVNYYVINSEGDRFPASGTTTQSYSLDGGVSYVTVTETLTGEGYTKDVDLYVEEEFFITTTGGTAIGEAPAIASLMQKVGGSNQLPLPSYLVPSYRASSITEGNNTVTTEYSNIDGVKYYSSNTIEVLYAETAPITEIDGQSIAMDVVTENYEVNVEYLYGGQLLTNEIGGYLVVDEINYELLTNDKGVLVDVIGYAVDRGINYVQITGLTDDFGQSFSTTIEPCTKIPHLIYDGLTTVDEETYGTSYDAALSLIVDQNAPYEDNVTPEEAPYLFTSGDYKVYNFTASYTYPTGESNSVPVDITYKEFSVETFDPKVFDFTSDEFLLIGRDDLLTPENSHPTGTEVLTLQSAPVYESSAVEIYSDSTARGYFKAAANGRVPQFETVLNTGGANGMYLSSTTMFKAEQEWFISMFFPVSDEWYFCGRSENGNGTYLRADSFRNLYVKIGGGTETNLGQILSDSDGNHIAWGNKDIGGGTWADTIYVNGNQIRLDNTTNRGTTDSDKPATIMSVWGIWQGGDTADTAPLLGSGGSCNGLRLSNTVPTLAQISGLYYRNTKHFMIADGGDSVTAGQGPTGDPWWLQVADRAKSLRYRMEFVNFAVGGSPRYAGGAETPASGFTKNLFGSGIDIDPWADQSCEDAYNTFYPECVLFGSGINAIASSVDKNPSGTGSLTTSTEVGNNAISDEQIWYTIAQKLKYAELGIMYFSSTVQPSNETNLVSDDNVPLRDALKIIGDNELAYYGSNDFQFDYINKLSTDGAGTGYKPEYSDESPNEVHPNDAGSTVIFNEIVSKTSPIFTASRDKNFDPLIEYLTLKDGDVINEAVLTVDWLRDGVLVSDTENLSVGQNTITRNYTNSYGRTGTKSISVTYVVQPTPQNHWPMTTNTAGEIVDLQGNDNMLILGTPTIDATGMTPQANGDGTVAQSAYVYCPLDSDWSYEYKVKILSGANIFSGLYHCGIMAPFNTGPTSVQFASDDIGVTLENQQNTNLTNDDRVADWKSTGKVVTIRLSYNNTTGKGSLIADGETFGDLNKGTLRALIPFSIGVESTSDSSFVAGNSRTDYTFKDVKYWDEIF